MYNPNKSQLASVSPTFKAYLNTFKWLFTFFEAAFFVVCEKV
jgi:hypothetical protein